MPMNFQETVDCKQGKGSINNKQDPVYIFETVSMVSWIVYIFPFLVKKRFLVKQEIKKLYYIDGSRLGVGLVSFTLKIFRAHLEQLKFQLFDLRDKKNDLYWVHIVAEELPVFQHKIKNSDIYQKIINQFKAENRLPEYLFKKILEIDPTVTNRRLIQLLLMSEVITSKIKDRGKLCLIIRHTLWLTEIRNFFETKGVDIMTLEKVNLRILLYEFLRKPIFKKYYHTLIYYWRRLQIFIASRRPFTQMDKQYLPKDKNLMPQTSSSNHHSKLAVEYYGHLNLGVPELHSDLFFWQTSRLSGDDIVICFQHAQDPLDARKFQEILKHKFHPLALNLKAVTSPYAPIFHRSNGIKRESRTMLDGKLTQGHSPEERWLKKTILGYQRDLEYWEDLFSQHDIKIWVAWYKFDANHIITADALKAMGGVSVIYQRSFEGFFFPGFAMNTDVAFAFSPLSSSIGKDSDSVVPYFVVTGYLGDHRFALLKKYSQHARNSLMSNGAKRSVAYLDESSSDDGRWYFGHDLTRKNYIFLLQKILENPDLGLILKPKVPLTLRRRLGPVAELLSETQKTGRCFIYEDGVLQGSYPPAVAALGADIAIHGHLMAGSAGVEAALTGTPTLLLNQEGCSVSSLCQLEEGRVIFRNCDDLWKACEDYWRSPKGIPGFGDWSSILDQIDPFRDGRAAERMGTYLSWMLEGFKGGLSRDTVLADAAERYRKAWGKDKVFSVNC